MPLALGILFKKNKFQVLVCFLVFTCGLLMYALKSTLFNVQFEVQDPEYRNAAKSKHTPVDLLTNVELTGGKYHVSDAVKNENYQYSLVEYVFKDVENSSTKLSTKDISATSSTILLDGQEIPLTNGVPNVLLPDKKTFLPHFRNPCWYESNLKNEKILKCLPYFFLAGMPKCGTTDLFSMLVKHPVIERTRKEPHWWTRRRFGNENRNYYLKNTKSVQGYIELFAPNINRIDRFKGKKVENSSATFYHRLIMGDGSASTFWDMRYWTGQVSLTPEEPTFTTANIFKQLIPNVKIIIILRNPVDRLYSDYLYFTGENKSRVEFHQRAVKMVNQLNQCILTYGTRSCAYAKLGGSLVAKIRIQIGMYHVFLEDWQKVFPPNQIMVVRLEDYTLQRPRYLQQIANFLEIEPYPDEILGKIEEERIANQRKKNDKKIGEMLQKTRLLLKEFYQPYNDKLAGILKDDKYKWR